MDSTNERIGLVINRNIQFYGTNFVYAFLGSAIVILFIGSIKYWKDFLIISYKKDEKDVVGRGYYYSYLEFQEMKKNMICLSCISLIFIIITLCVPKGDKIIYAGLITIVTLYLLYLLKRHWINKYPFDLFEDFVWVYNKYMKSQSSIKILEKSKED